MTETTIPQLLRISVAAKRRNTKGNKPTEWQDVLQSLRDRREPPRTGIGEGALAWGYGMPGAKRPAVLP